MLTAVAFVPTPPLLVPELAGAAAAETEDLRIACGHAVQLLAETAGSWTAIGTDRLDAVLSCDAHGSWSSFGADIRVALGPHSASGADAELPLPALIAGWLRGQQAPNAAIRLRLYGPHTPASRCRALGRALATDEPTALLVLGDGCTTLTEKAPGAFDARAAALQRRIDTALSGADGAALAALEAGLCAELGVSGRVAWQVAVAAAGEGWRGRSLYEGAPFGVGYQVATWQR